MDNLKLIMEELAKRSSVDNTHYLANLINSYFKDAAKVNVSTEGDTKITINLKANEVKYLMTEIYKNVSNE